MPVENDNFKGKKQKGFIFIYYCFGLGTLINFFIPG